MESTFLLPLQTKMGASDSAEKKTWRSASGSACPKHEGAAGGELGLQAAPSSSQIHRDSSNTSRLTSNPNSFVNHSVTDKKRNFLGRGAEGHVLLGMLGVAGRLLSTKIFLLILTTE